LFRPRERAFKQFKRPRPQFVNESFSLFDAYCIKDTHELYDFVNRITAHANSVQKL